jgi:hypothetical protein
VDLVQEPPLGPHRVPGPEALPVALVLLVQALRLLAAHRPAREAAVWAPPAAAALVEVHPADLERLARAPLVGAPPAPEAGRPGVVPVGLAPAVPARPGLPVRARVVRPERAVAVVLPQGPPALEQAHPLGVHRQGRGVPVWRLPAPAAQAVGLLQEPLEQRPAAEERRGPHRAGAAHLPARAAAMIMQKHWLRSVQVGATLRLACRSPSSLTYCTGNVGSTLRRFPLMVRRRRHGLPLAEMATGNGHW